MAHAATSVFLKFIALNLNVCNDFYQSSQKQNSTTYINNFVFDKAAKLLDWDSSL